MKYLVSVAISNRLPSNIGACYYPETRHIEISINNAKRNYPKKWRRVIIGYFFHELTHHFMSFVKPWKTDQDLYNEERICYRVQFIVCCLLLIGWYYPRSLKEQALISTRFIAPSFTLNG